MRITLIKLSREILLTLDALVDPKGSEIASPARTDNLGRDLYEHEDSPLPVAVGNANAMIRS